MYGGKIFGIRLKVNIFLLLLIAVYSYLGLWIEILLIFSAVFLHETAHCLVALILKIKITEIELLPFGGQAKIEDFTGLDPDKEIMIAVAGPIISLLLSGFFYFLFPYNNPANSYVEIFITVNFLLGVFNLLPALPMDGGRILRALLSPRVGYKKATRSTAWLGKIIALSFIGYGGYETYLAQNGINYMVVGSLLFWAANREEKHLIYSFMRYLVNKKSDLQKNGFLPVKQVISSRETEIKKILNNTSPSFYIMVAVIDAQHHILGIYSESELIEALLAKGPGVKCSQL